MSEAISASFAVPVQKNDFFCRLKADRALPVIIWRRKLAAPVKEMADHLLDLPDAMWALDTLHASSRQMGFTYLYLNQQQEVCISQNTQGPAALYAQRLEQTLKKYGTPEIRQAFIENHVATTKRMLAHAGQPLRVRLFTDYAAAETPYTDAHRDRADYVFTITYGERGIVYPRRFQSAADGFSGLSSKNFLYCQAGDVSYHRGEMLHASPTRPKDGRDARLSFSLYPAA